MEHVYPLLAEELVLESVFSFTVGALVPEYVVSGAWLLPG